MYKVNLYGFEFVGYNLCLQCSSDSVFKFDVDVWVVNLKFAMT